MDDHRLPAAVPLDSLWAIEPGAGEHLARALSALSPADVAADPRVRALLLNVDSPGGSVSGLAELADTVLAARQQKPVWAQVSGMAASAAYYVASQAQRIVAHRMDMIGSIGTRMMLYDFSKMFAESGIRAVPTDTGEFKSAGALGTEITDRQRAYFQSVIDGFFSDFVSVIGRLRQSRR